MKLFVTSVTEMAGAMEVTKYPNSPLIKADTGKPVLVASDGVNNFILGYVTKGDISNPVLVYSQFISGSIGHVHNDLYNNVQNADDLSTTKSNKMRSVLYGHSEFIGARFHDGVDGTDYGFKNKKWFITKNYGGDGGELAPVAPSASSEAYYLAFDSGNKVYHSSSGSLQEANAMRINIGIGATDLFSYGTWDLATLTVETPEERLARAISEGTYASGARVGFPDPSTYHIFNFVDNSNFFMGNGIIEIEKSNNDNSVFAKTVYDSAGVTISADATGKVIIDVNGTTLTIEDGVVTVLGTMTYDGDVTVTGNLVVQGTTDLTGKLTTAGGADLA